MPVSHSKLCTQPAAVFQSVPQYQQFFIYQTFCVHSFHLIQCFFSFCVWFVLCVSRHGSVGRFSVVHFNFGVCDIYYYVNLN